MQEIKRTCYLSQQVALQMEVDQQVKAARDLPATGRGRRLSSRPSSVIFNS